MVWVGMNHGMKSANQWRSLITVMPEALEKWPVNYVQNLIPRCYMIIEEINRRFNLEMQSHNVSEGAKWAMNIIKDGQIHMTNLAIYTCYSVNGVALHTKILETMTFKDFYKYTPEKFNNKTNGVTSSMVGLFQS